MSFATLPFPVRCNNHNGNDDDNNSIVIETDMRLISIIMAVRTMIALLPKPTPSHSRTEAAESHVGRDLRTSGAGYS